MSTTLRHGPQLPYKLIAGVVPCGSGWLVGSAKVQGVTVAPEDPRKMATFIDVLDDKPAFSVIAIYAPIGYLEKPQPRGRTCDREARRLLGRHRGASVRSAPTWRALNSPSPRPEGLDAVTARLFPRYCEVAQEMAPYRQRTVFEVHPELTLFQLNGDQPLRYSKRFVVGREERRALLLKRIPGVERILDTRIPGVSPWHLLDAAACLWTARRLLVRAVNRIPKDPEWDSQGLRMEFVW